MPLDKVPYSMTDPDLTAAIAALIATAKSEAISLAVSQSLVKLAGDVVQSVNTQNGALGSSVVVIPLDDTIPQITEGTEIMTATITPTDADNILEIDVVAYLANNTGVTNVAALFKDSGANALAAGASSSMGVANALTPVVFKHRMVAGSTSAATFRVRVGPSGAVTMTINGSAGARLFGGVFASSITIKEIKV